MKINEEALIISISHVPRDVTDSASSISQELNASCADCGKPATRWMWVGPDERIKVPHSKPVCLKCFNQALRGMLGQR